MRLPFFVSFLLTAGCLAGPILPKPFRVAQIMDAPATNIRGAKVEADPAFAATAERLRAQLGTGGTTTVQLVKATGPVRGFEVGDEGYVIEAHPGQPVRIHARTEAGAFYGIITLQQHAYAGNDGGLYVPPGDVMDKPRFAWRGLMIDDGRHIMGKAQILRMLDLMALHKLNTLHWHLTEDQGWRVEIKKYPKLTEVGSKRDASPTMGNRNKPDGKPYAGFYTQEDLKEVVAYATKLHINVIPEIEMPGHAAAAIAAYPNLGNTDIPGYNPKVASSWGVKYYTFAPKEETFAFIDDIFAELCPIFPNAFFHIGGDESPKDQWNKSPFAKEVMAKEKLKDAHELQSYFISRVEKLLNKRGKRLIGWDEILEGGLAPNATVMSWRGEAGGIAAAKSGHDAIMTPGQPCYWDHYQSKDPGEPHAIGGFNPVELVYLYNPVPAELSADEAKHILGAQANLWTEYVLTPEHAEYMILPRQLALAEVLWTGPRRSEDLPDFRIRATQRSRALKARGFNVAPHFLLPESKPFRRREPK